MPTIARSFWIVVPFLVFTTSIGAMAPSSRRASRRKASSSITANELSATLQELHQADLLPKLLVFDLDNTVWTPELYQLYQKPKANTDIRLFPDVTTILETLYKNEHHTMRCAIASRASEDDWANDLLDEFRIVNVPMRDLFPEPSLIHIVGRSKTWHLERIREASSIDYSDMIFYDDAMFNMDVVSPLGVFCCHTPRGLTLDLFHSSLRDFANVRKERRDAV